MGRVDVNSVVVPRCSLWVRTEQNGIINWNRFNYFCAYCVYDRQYCQVDEDDFEVVGRKDKFISQPENLDSLKQNKAIYWSLCTSQLV